MKRCFWAIFLLSLSLCFAGVNIGCSNTREVKASAPEALCNIPVLTAQRANVPDLLEAMGTVHASETSQVASQMMGNIVQVLVHEGDRVQRGQILATIDDRQPRSALDRALALQLSAQQETAAADSDLSLAEATFKRYEVLFQKKAASPQEFDEIKARQQAALARRDMARAGQEQAKAAVVQARTSLEYTQIRAPFNGVVTERKADPGVLATTGMPIFTIENIGHYRLEVTVNEGDLHYLHLDQQAEYVLDALDGQPHSGRISQIVPAVDPASRTFVVKIALASSPQLRSGLFGRALFTRGQKPALMVPRSSVVARGQLDGVYVLDQNRVVNLRYVTLGKETGQQVEVLAGLEHGEQFVSAPGSLNLSGRRIE